MELVEMVKTISIVVFGLAIFIIVCILMLRDEYVFVKEALGKRSARKKGGEKA